MSTFEIARLIVEVVLMVLVAPFTALLGFMLRKALNDITAGDAKVSNLTLSVQENDAKQGRELSEAKLKLEKEMAAFQLLVANTYVTQNDLTKAIDAFNRSIDAIFKKLERIEDKLDLKADKQGVVHG